MHAVAGVTAQDVGGRRGEPANRVARAAGLNGDAVVAVSQGRCATASRADEVAFNEVVDARDDGNAIGHVTGDKIGRGRGGATDGVGLGEVDQDAVDRVREGRCAGGVRADFIARNQVSGRRGGIEPHAIAAAGGNDVASP